MNQRNQRRRKTHKKLSVWGRKIYVISRQIWPCRIRSGSRSSTEPKPWSKRTSKKVSAVKATTIRINPGIPRKLKRRSSLSSQVIATHGKDAQFARKVDRVVLNAMAINAALPPDICAFGESSPIVFREADPPLHAIAALLTLARERTYCAKKDTALRRTCPAWCENGSFRGVAHAGAIHEHRRGTSSGAKQHRHLGYFAHGTIDCGGRR